MYKRGDVVVVRGRSIDPRIAIILDAPNHNDVVLPWVNPRTLKHKVLLGTDKIMVDGSDLYESFEKMKQQDESIMRIVQQIRDAQAASPSSKTSGSQPKP